MIDHTIGRYHLMLSYTSFVAWAVGGAYRPLQDKDPHKHIRQARGSSINQFPLFHVQEPIHHSLQPLTIKRYRSLRLINLSIPKPTALHQSPNNVCR
jgi:hypothetical protein